MLESSTDRLQHICDSGIVYTICLDCGMHQAYAPCLLQSLHVSHFPHALLLHHKVFINCGWSVYTYVLLILLVGISTILSESCTISHYTHVMIFAWYAVNVILYLTYMYVSFISFRGSVLNDSSISDAWCAHDVMFSHSCDDNVLILDDIPEFFCFIMKTKVHHVYSSVYTWSFPESQYFFSKN